jgi:cation:H+ antiporter
MPVYLSILILIMLFAVLGFSANIVVNGIKKIAHKLSIPIFLLGLVLGLLTSLPELSIAVNAAIRGIEEVSVGNLLGGIVVLLALILGLNLILNRKVKTDGKIMTPLPGFALLLLPLLLGLDGKLGIIDGIILCTGYVGVLIHFYRQNHSIIEKPGFSITLYNRKMVKEIALILGGSLVIVVSSNIMIRLTTDILNQYHISGFLVGLMVFSLGTNLPELVVTITSWRKKVKEVAFSHLLGSAIANPLILGGIALLNPISISVDRSFLLILYFFPILFVMLLFFYRSEKSLSRIEGIFLLLMFLTFGFLQIHIFY